MTTKKEHDQHIAEALAAFYQINGDEDEWSDYQCMCHDKLIARINEEDGEITEITK